MGSNGFEQMRSGILEIRKALHKMYIGEIPLEKHTISAVIGRCDSLLEMPLRNCDVGTEKDQYDRMRIWFRDHTYPYGWSDERALKWSQLPYASEEE